MDQTLYTTKPTQNLQTHSIEQDVTERGNETSNLQSHSLGHDNPAPPALQTESPESARSNTIPTVISMSQTELARYADQVNVVYPTTSGAELYRIAEIIPRSRRNAFEEGLGDTIDTYYAELARRGQEPDEKPIPDVLAIYVLPGLVTAAELYEGYLLANAADHAQAFLTTLRARNTKALEVLENWLKGNRLRETVLIERLPRPTA